MPSCSPTTVSRRTVPIRLASGSDKPANFTNLALTAAVTPPGGGLALFRSGRYALPFGTIDIAVDESSFSTGGRALTSFQPAADLDVEGLQNQYRTPGIGVPMAASVAPTATPSQGIRVAPRLRVPSTALLDVPDPRRQLAGVTLHGTLTVHTIFAEPTVRLGGEVVRLEFDQAAARAYSLVENQAWADEYRGLLLGDLFRDSRTPSPEAGTDEREPFAAPEPRGRLA